MSERYQFARFASSKAGHDKNQLYIILDAVDDYVYVVDGRLKTLEKPKRKNIRHIQIINDIDVELVRKKKNNEIISNEDIKKAIKLYKSRIQNNRR